MSRKFRNRISKPEGHLEHKIPNLNYANHLIDTDHSLTSDFKIFHEYYKGMIPYLCEVLKVNQYLNSRSLLYNHVDLN